MKSTFYINIQCGKHTNHAHCLISENKEESSEIIAPVLESKQTCFDPMLSSTQNIL